MKKFLTLALCVAGVASMSAQKANVEAAKKLAGKADKVEEARGLIKEAMENPETANDAQTYFVAGQIEFKPNEKAISKKQLEPNYEIDEAVFYDHLLRGYNEYLKVLPLDRLPDEKGKVKPKYTSTVLKDLKENLNRFYEGGAYYYNNKEYYPEAYESFSAFGDIPVIPEYEGKAPLVADSARALAYYYAGIAAWSNKTPELGKAAEAFGKARMLRYNDPNAAIYEIACWENIAKNDSTLADEANAKTLAICRDGLEQFGLSQPIFVNNLVESALNNGDAAGAEQIVNDLMAQYPDNPTLYGLIGYIADREGNEAKAEEAYRKAVDLPGVTFDTRLLASRKLYLIGNEKLENAQTAAEKKDLIDRYMREAKRIAEAARAQDPGNPRINKIDDVLDRVDYRLNTAL